MIVKCLGDYYNIQPVTWQKLYENKHECMFNNFHMTLQISVIDFNEHGIVQTKGHARSMFLWI